MLSTRRPAILLATFLLIPALALIIPAGAAADGDPGERTLSTGGAGANPGADASFDRRLPPVFPGEEVSDGKRKLKVWSSSGPVPVARAPEPWKDENSLAEHGIDDVDVLVDRRDKRK